MNRTGLVVRVSSYSHSKTLDRLTRAIADHGATVFAVIDHATNAATVGLELPPTSVVIFGNPKVGTPLMRIAPNLAVELPSRVLVRDTAANTTEVVYMDPVMLAERYNLDEVSGLSGLIHVIDQALAEPVDVIDSTHDSLQDS